ncbi:MAG: helicase [Bosea sp.]|nr:helicase [Bosea sp. (in: a-proteobacteria)]
MLMRSLPPAVRTRGVTAVLGPTNTGKTHYALDRMAAHATGMIGLPLRLLAREVYGRLVERVGAQAVALVTGEEKIKPDKARFWVSTVEAMPRDVSVDFVAVDEIQLAADLDRGHVFTDRLLNQRGRSETLLIGSGTMRPLIEQLLPGVHVVTRPRLSQLSFAGEKKLTRLPPRAAIVAFSADEVYAVAELIRRQKGGAAVVMGSLSPRTRNAQVELFQAGDVDYLVATDAIGMGLNLDVEQIAFASDRKFDGQRFRQLTPPEFGQIAGRAGRHMRDGLFGSTGRCPPLDPELVEAIENHRFDPVRNLQWRNPDLDFRTLKALKAALAVLPNEAGLSKALAADDEIALEIVSADPELRNLANGREAVQRLWDACQVPDYRKSSPQVHAELVGTLYRFLMQQRVIPADWLKRQIAMLDRIDGDIDTLSSRIAQIRTWTFVANRPDWLADPEHWQGLARQVEDKLSDALHERLAARFVDRRTSVLMRRLRENTMLEAQVTATGDVTVEGQHVGSLSGFHFIPDANATGPEAKALNAAAQKALVGELEARAARLSLAADDAIVLANDGIIRWTGEPVARLAPGEKILAPRIRLIADENLPPAAREPVEQRLELWLKAHLTRHLGALLVLEEAPGITGMARGLAFQLSESLGVLDRAKVANDVKGLEQDARAALRKHGVRFGAYHLYMPLLLKPAPRGLASQLWALKHGGLDQPGRDEIAYLALSGRTSIPANKEVPRDLYRSAGFHVAGERALRVDILERLADLIRPAIAYRPGVTPGEPPAGAADGDGFVITGAMTSLVGASGPDFANVLKALGYAVSTRLGPAITVPLLKPAPTEALVVKPAAGDDASDQEPGEQGSAEAGTGKADAADQELAADAFCMDAAPGGDQTEVPAATMAEAPAREDVAADKLAAETPAAEAPAAEAPADASAAEAPAAPAAAAEIEVWRPQRKHQHQGPRRAERGQGRGRGPEGADQARRANRRGRVVYRAPEPGEVVAAPADPARAERQNRPRPERNAIDRTDGPRPVRTEAEAQRPDRAGRPFKARDGAPERAPRDDARNRPPGARDGRGPRPDQREARPSRPESQAPRPDRQPDPDSPFAKLAALKAQLEGQRKP